MHLELGSITKLIDLHIIISFFFQNKNWTLLSSLVILMNSESNHLEKITLKYFEVGHSFMSADSFHHRVEKAAKRMKNIYNYDDYVTLMESVGTPIQMRIVDFLHWENHLSQGKASVNSRPYLLSVAVLEFRQGDTAMYYKSSHDEYEPFRKADFLKLKVKRKIKEAWVQHPNPKAIIGIEEDRLDGIIKICFR